MGWNLVARAKLVDEIGKIKAVSSFVNIRSNKIGILKEFGQYAELV